MVGCVAVLAVFVSTRAVSCCRTKSERVKGSVRTTQIAPVNDTEKRNDALHVAADFSQADLPKPLQGYLPFLGGALRHSGVWLTLDFPLLV